MYTFSSRSGRLLFTISPFLPEAFKPCLILLISRLEKCIYLKVLCIFTYIDFFYLPIHLYIYFVYIYIHLFIYFPSWPIPPEGYLGISWTSPTSGGAGYLFIMLTIWLMFILQCFLHYMLSKPGYGQQVASFTCLNMLKQM